MANDASKVRVGLADYVTGAVTYGPVMKTVPDDMDVREPPGEVARNLRGRDAEPSRRELGDEKPSDIAGAEHANAPPA